MSGRVATGSFGVLLLALAASVVLAPVRREPPAVYYELPRPVDPHLQMSVVTLKRGRGPAAREGDKVTVRYTGKTPSASTAAVTEGTPGGGLIEFVLGEGQVIAGWDEGIPGMKVGEKRRLLIPPALAYGSRGKEGIAPGEELSYEVELVSIRVEDHDD